MEKKYILIVVVLVFNLSINAQSIFQKTFGGTYYDEAQSVQQTTDGGFIITGWTDSFGEGEADIFLIKTDASGDIQWSRTYGESVYDFGYSVQQTSDGGYIITGWTYSFGEGEFDVYVIKTEANGDVTWSKTYGGTDNDAGNSVQQTSDGGYIIAGSTSSFGEGANDVYLLKTDTSGDTIWTKTYGGSNNEEGYSVQQTNDGGYIVNGTTSSLINGESDVFLLKTDYNGDTIWTKSYGGSNSEGGYSVQQTSDGGFIITGKTLSFNGGVADAYLLKTNANGDLLWSKTYGGSSDDAAYSVQQTIDGGYIITGYTYSFGNVYSDVYLIKTDANGGILWSKTYYSSDDNKGVAVQQSTDGGYVIVGFSNLSASGGDIYFIKTDINGNSGCNEGSPNTILSAPSTIIGSTTTIIGSGAIITSPQTVDNSVIPTDSVLCSSLDVQEQIISSGNIQVYPNPFNKIATVEFENPKKEKHTLIMFNTSGYMVRQIVNITGEKIELDKGNIKDGLYLFQLCINDEIIGNMKVVVKEEF